MEPFWPTYGSMSMRKKTMLKRQNTKLLVALFKFAYLLKLTKKIYEEFCTYACVYLILEEIYQLPLTFF